MSDTSTSEPTLLVGVQAASELSGIPVGTIRHGIHTETGMGILFRRIGKRRLARRADIQQWIDDQFVGGAA